jgi:hypothetical protein
MRTRSGSAHGFAEHACSCVASPAQPTDSLALNGTTPRPTRPRDARLAVHLTTSVVVAAISLRILLYLRNPSVWHDEAALLVNVTGKSFSALLGPLEFAEAAPPLFMWLERAIAIGLGSETLAVRFPALLAGCATLLVLVPVAVRALPPPAVPLTLTILGFSAKLLAHSVEAKPYAIDVLCSAASLWLFLRSRDWTPVKRLLTFSVLAPCLLWLSYPAAFVVGGTILAGVVDMRRDRDYKVALAAGLLVAATGIASALLVQGPVRAQRVLPLMQVWRSALPDYEHWWTIPEWLIRQTLGVADYGFRPLGGLLLAAAAVGVPSLWRRDRALTIALAAPWALAIVAALMGEYPYSGSRVLVFTLPALAICSAQGAYDLMTRYGTVVRRIAVVTMAVAVAGALVVTARDAVAILNRPDAAAAARFVRSQVTPGDVVRAPYWEYHYYLAEGDAGLLNAAARSGSHKEWLIIHGSSPADRDRILQALYGRAGARLERHDFHWVSVYVVRRG